MGRWAADDLSPFRRSDGGERLLAAAAAERSSGAGRAPALRRYRPFSVYLYFTCRVSRVEEVEEAQVVVVEGEEMEAGCGRTAVTLEAALPHTPPPLRAIISCV